ncbi:hypothetical protein BSKO_01777 [Bryopsis sp. KO-2023]|nr:hypothetical protein BSKO_01777 [Bryopsis sp. KO-2023]
MGDYDRRRRDRYVEFRPRGGRRFVGRGGGRKRGREEPEETPEQAFIKEVMELGDADKRTSKPVEKQLEDFLPRLHREIKNNPDLVKDTILNCAIELSTKTPQYATLIGFLNVEDAEFVKELLQKANDDFSAALSKPDIHRARLLFRLFASLVASNVLLPSSLVELIDVLLNAVISTLETTQDSTGRSWQPWTDYIVNIILMALPWGGSELADSAPAEFTSVFEKVEKYANERPIQNDVALRPFLASIKEDDIAAKSDSGSASFLSEVWEAIKELKDKSLWKCQSIIRTSELIDHKLAAGHPIALPGITAPTGPPGVSPDMPISQQACIVNSSFPPRGGICLLDPIHTGGELPAIERLIVEEYIIDTLHFFQEDRVACAQRLAKSIPSPYPISPLLAEVLFSHMLMLPNPPLKPVAYGTLMVNLCQFTDLGPFPRGLSGCVRELFSRMPALDPELSHRLAEWLCFHLSNLGFIWPWQKWKRVLEAPEYDPQRLFIRSTLTKLVNLSFLENVKENISAKEFHSLLPPALEIKPVLPPPIEIKKDPAGENPEQNESKASESADQNADVEMGEGENGAGKNSENEPEKEKEDVMEVVAVEEASPGAKLTDELVQLMNGKQGYDAVKEWMESRNFETVLEGKDQALQGFIHAILLSGFRSTTHTIKVMERYIHLLHELAELSTKKCVIEKVVEAWSSSTQRICLVLTSMSAIGLISGEDMVEWAFGSAGIAEEGTGVEVLRGWDVIRCALEHEVAAVKSAEAVVKEAELTVKDSEEAAQHAAHVAADAAERLEHGDGDNAIMVDRITSANRAESKAREEVESAVARVTEKKDAVGRAKDRQRALLLKVYKCFARVLSEKPSADPGEEMEGKEDLRLYYRNLAHLASFSRGAYLESEPLQQILTDDVFCEGKVPAETRSILFKNLRSGNEADCVDVSFDLSLFVKKRVGEKEPSLVQAQEKADGAENADAPPQTANDPMEEES